VHLAHGKVIPTEVIKERTTLAAEGVVCVAVPVSDGSLAGRVQVVARGVASEPGLGEVVAAAALEAERVGGSDRWQAPDGHDLKEAVRMAVRRVFCRAVGYKPQVLVMLVSTVAPGVTGVS
jgi:mRNA degradation ribonuclease J1/J2